MFELIDHTLLIIHFNVSWCICLQIKVICPTKLYINTIQSGYVNILSGTFNEILKLNKLSFEKVITIEMLRDIPNFFNLRKKIIYEITFLE